MVVFQYLCVFFFRMGILQHIRDSAPIPSLVTPIVLRSGGDDGTSGLAAGSVGHEGIDYDTYLRFKRPDSIQWPHEVKKRVLSSPDSLPSSLQDKFDILELLNSLVH